VSPATTAGGGRTAATTQRATDTCAWFREVPFALGRRPAVADNAASRDVF